MEVAVPVVIEIGVSELVKSSGSVIYTILKSKSVGRKMKEKLSALRSAINEEMELSSDAHIERLKTLLDEGLNAVTELEKVGWFNIYGKCVHVFKIKKFDKRFTEFVNNQGMVNIMVDQPRLNKDMEETKSELKELIRHMEEMKLELESVTRPQIENVYGRLNNNSVSNAFLLQNVSSHEQVFSDGGYSYGGQEEEVVAPPKFVVGLEKSVYDLKCLLLQEDVNCIVVSGMGGSGKTTVAKALCTDEEVKCRFGRTVFIEVSWAPNLMSILETIWNKLVQWECWPKFNKEEEAIGRLRFHLSSRITQPTLLVFDDVWETMDCLFLNIKNYKTIITTRVTRLIPEENDVRFYQLSRLQPNHARNLFCYWAFGIGGCALIPVGEYVNLVVEVAEVCGGLPLFLEVFGSYLHGKPLPDWQSTKNKLLELSEHIGLQQESPSNCLEDSISVIEDDEVKHQCN